MFGAGQELLPSLLQDRSSWVRAQAAEWAADHHAPSVIESLLPLLDDPSGRCKFATKDSLLRMGKIVVDPLAQYISLRAGRSVETALEVAIGLCDPRLMDAASRLSHDETPRVRALAMAMLGTLGGDESVELLLKMLSDPVATVRVAAAHALGKLAHWPSAPNLAPLLHDTDWNVRKEASLALKACGAPGMLYLRRAASDDDMNASDMAQQILASQRSEEYTFST